MKPGKTGWEQDKAVGEQHSGMEVSTGEAPLHHEDNAVRVSLFVLYYHDRKDNKGHSAYTKST